MIEVLKALYTEAEFQKYCTKKDMVFKHVFYIPDDSIGGFKKYGIAHKYDGNCYIAQIIPKEDERIGS